MRIRKLNHSVYQLQYHIVWGTKYRRKILKAYVRDYLTKSLMRMIRKHPGWYIQKINTGEDHVHMLIEIPPKYIKRIYEKKEGMWSVGYFVSSVGLNEETIRKYVEMQNNEDKGKDISEEFS